MRSIAKIGAGSIETKFELLPGGISFWGFAVIIRPNHRVIGVDYCLCSD
jgi:hypothetical protein